MWPVWDSVPDCDILGSIPAKATQASADLNLVISPNSEMIPAQEIVPIPLMDKIGGLSSLIIDSILFSSLLISTSIWEWRISNDYNSVSNISFEIPIEFLASSLSLIKFAEVNLPRDIFLIESKSFIFLILSGVLYLFKIYKLVLEK